jgi:CubicO group peptidase (beta-lactamase class C family)
MAAVPDWNAVDALFAPYDRLDRPGAVVGVAHRGRTVYRRAFGLANVEHAVAMTPATRLTICSVTKHMTCAAALQLEAEGKLSLDDPIGRWIPEVAAVTGRPTLRQLMDHTGGVRCHFDVAAFNGVIPHPVGSGFKTLQRQQTVNFEPGDGMMYCNGGYLLLSLAIERAAGMEFGECLRDRLFQPLRMDATRAPRFWWPVQPNLATLYMPHPGGGWRHGFGFEEETLGNGSVISSLDDMLRWATHLRESTGPVSLERLTTHSAHPDALRAGVYRLGLTDQRWRGMRVVEHGGGAVGASCHLLIIPEAELDVFVFFNCMDPAQEVARQVAALALGQTLPFASGEVHLSSSRHRDLHGHYLDPVQGMVVGFGDTGDDKLGVSLLAGPFVPALVPHEASCGELPFHVPTAVGPRYFRRGPDGALEWLDGPTWRRLVPVEIDPVASEDWLADFANVRFRSEEAAATVRLSERDGVVVLESSGDFGRWDFPSRSIARDLFAFGFYQGASSWLARVHRAADGTPAALEMSGSRTRGLVFQRCDP